MYPDRILNIFEVRTGDVMEFTFQGNASKTLHNAIGHATSEISYDTTSGLLLRKFRDVFVPATGARIKHVWVPANVEQLVDFKPPQSDAY